VGYSEIGAELTKDLEMSRMYTQSHEWIEINGPDQEVGTVGITEHAQRELGEIVYVEFPIVGKFVQRGEIIAVLESTKAAVDVYSPVSGTILESNHLLQQHPEIINTAPEREGWIFRIALSEPEELQQLLPGDMYLACRDG